MEGIEFNGEVDYYCQSLGAWAVFLIYDLHIECFALSQINRFLFGCSSNCSLSDKTWFVRNGCKCLYGSSCESYRESVMIFQHSNEQEVWRIFALQILWKVPILVAYFSTALDFKTGIVKWTYMSPCGSWLQYPAAVGILLLRCYDSVNKLCIETVCVDPCDRLCSGSPMTLSLQDTLM